MWRILVPCTPSVVRGLICVVALFIICWGPTLIVQLLIGLSIIIEQRQSISLGLDTLTYFSSAVNPYIFMTMSSQFSEPIMRRLQGFGKRKADIFSNDTAVSRTTDLTSAANVTEPTLPSKF
ncbi:hypothetical protein ACF0H5_015878 [Mactra antiquata]